jgi:hypothetical protein
MMVQMKVSELMGEDKGELSFVLERGKQCRRNHYDITWQCERKKFWPSGHYQSLGCMIVRPVRGNYGSRAYPLEHPEKVSLNHGVLKRRKLMFEH